MGGGGGTRGGGEEGGDPRVVITPHLPLSPHWGRIILAAQGHPPLVGPNTSLSFQLQTQESVIIFNPVAFPSIVISIRSSAS